LCAMVYEREAPAHNLADTEIGLICWEKCEAK
jgi:hypothetical protein